MQTFIRFASFLALGTLTLGAQTTTKPAVHHTAATGTAHKAATATPACEKLPEISPAIPSLGPGAHCFKTLYSISIAASHFDPAMNPALRENLSKNNQSFALQYVDIKIGTGELAKPEKFYTVHYTGYLIDGTKFDSSVDRNEPFNFPYGAGRVIQGWDTGFEGMHLGGKRRLYIPYQLAYGAQGRPPKIPAKAELIFDMELISQSDAPPEPKTPPAAPQQPKPDGDVKPAGTPPAPSPAGSAAPPPVTSTTPAGSTQPAKPAVPKIQ